jgi:hypothetical protein
MSHELQQSVIDTAKLDSKRCRRTQQKTPESLRVGEAWQTRQKLEGAVGTQEGCGFYAI